MWSNLPREKGREEKRERERKSGKREKEEKREFFPWGDSRTN